MLSSVAKRRVATAWRRSMQGMASAPQLGGGNPEVVVVPEPQQDKRKSSLPAVLPAVLRERQASPTRNNSTYGRYDVQHVLGKGRFGVVRLGVDRESEKGHHVALKEISKKHDSPIVQAELDLLRDLMTLNELNKVFSTFYTVPLDILETEDKYVIVLEYLCGGDLFDRIMIKGHVEEVYLRPVIKTMLKEIVLLHENGIVHRDIKPENVMFRRKGEPSSEEFPHSHQNADKVPWDRLEPVLCDFGLSYKNGSDALDIPAGTFGYAAPEMLSRERRTSRACDIWSLGVTMYSSLAGELPFPASSDGSITLEQHLAEAFRGPRFKSARFANVSEEACDLISQMLHYSPYTRIDMESVLRHPWFSCDLPKPPAPLP